MGDLVGRQGVFAGASLQPEGAGCLLEPVAVVISAVGGGGDGGQAKRWEKGGT